jgi:hypothetical protein
MRGIQKKIWIFVLLIITTFLIFSCSITDYRLQGVYTNYSKDRRGDESWGEVQFKGNRFFRNTKFKISGVESNYDFEYKIKIIFTNDQGGSFYSINTFHTDDKFNDSSVRRVWGYTLSGNRLILEDDKGEKSTYTRK